MQKEQTIISITELSCGQFDSQQVHTFDSRKAAKNAIEKKLDEDLALGRKSIPELGISPVEGSLRDLWSKTEGNVSFSIGSHEYRIAFLNVPGEYPVTDTEVFSALDALCNSNRSTQQYQALAEHISRNMHRYVQNELWKFVKQLIRAFACGGSDKRNATAHDQAQAVFGFITLQM